MTPPQDTDWQAFYQQDRPDLERLLRPEPWQEELARDLETGPPGAVLEAGSGYGLVSLLLARRRRVCLLDRESRPLATASRLFAMQGRQGRFVQGDLFALPFARGSFAQVFNAGVLEHFGLQDRARALAAMARVLAPGGRLVVAVPNHFSRPYAHAYRYLRACGRWPYPPEEAIHDLRQELDLAGLDMEMRRRTVCAETALHFLRRHQRLLFRLLALVRPHEGYLCILEMTEKIRK